MYMDDVSVGGTVEDVLHDLEIVRAAECLGLSLNPAKCEVICKDHTLRGHMISLDPDKAYLLGSPLASVPENDAALNENIQALLWVLVFNSCCPMTLSPFYDTLFPSPSFSTFYGLSHASCLTTHLEK